MGYRQRAAVFSLPASIKRAESPLSYIQSRGADDHKVLPLNREMFKNGRAFNISAIVIIAILVILYTLFWQGRTSIIQHP